MSCDAFSTGPPPWWNGFSAMAEDNELYSISSRGRPTAASIATLVNLGGLSGTGCSRESERCCPAVVWHSALNDFSTGNSSCCSSRYSSRIYYVTQKLSGRQSKAPTDEFSHITACGESFHNSQITEDTLKTCFRPVRIIGSIISQLEITAINANTSNHWEC